jgi:hypothetical protein
MGRPREIKARVVPSRLSRVMEKESSSTEESRIYSDDRSVNSRISVGMGSVQVEHPQWVVVVGMGEQWVHSNRRRSLGK